MFQAISDVNVFILPCYNAMHATGSGMENLGAFCFCVGFCLCVCVFLAPANAVHLEWGED